MTEAHSHIRGAALDMSALEGELKTGLASARTLEDGCRALCDLLWTRLEPSLVLSRTYVMMPLYRLPDRERAYADSFARSKGIADRLTTDTSVLTLMATRGKEASWNDRALSQRHVAIPLADQRFVASVPMVASLLSSLGVDLGWFDVSRDILIRKLVGGFNGNFFVPDARTARDNDQRLIIPAQDFVEKYQVRSVFGFGGAWVNGWIAATILFTRETLTHTDVLPFASLVTTFKLATADRVATGQIFRSP